MIDAGMAGTWLSSHAESAGMLFSHAQLQKLKGHCRKQLSRPWWFAFGIVLLLVSFSDVVRGQEAVRMSLAGAEAAEARRRAAATIGYYNFKLGPTGWRLGAGLSVEYNDNVVLREEDPLDDFIFRPELRMQMLWPITDKNAINLNLGGGYAAYILHPELSRYYITPGSELSFDVYVGDFWINLHDRFSITENAYQDPTVVGSGDYSRLENALGLSATWHLNKVIIRSGYDHVNYLALQGNAGQPDGVSEVASASVGYELRGGMVAGLELGGALLNYSGTNVTFSDAKQWHAGFFLEGQVSEYMHVHASVGYTDYSPENPTRTVIPITFTNGTGTNLVFVPRTGDYTGIYAQLDLRHRLNQFVDYTLSGGRSINFAFYGGTVDLIYARLAANWRLVRKVGIATAFDYEHGTQVDIFGETFDRYGANINFSRGITAKLSANLGYQFYWRTSDLPGRNYVNNIVSLGLNYTF